MPQTRNTTPDDLRPEYDLQKLLKGATRGKYAKSYQASSNVVALDPDVHHIFRDARAVNDALRLVIELRKVGGQTRDYKKRLMTSTLAGLEILHIARHEQAGPEEE